MAESKARARFEGCAVDLYEVLKPFAAKSKKWLKYDETPRVTDAKVVPELLFRHADVIEALHGICGNLCFKRSTVVQAMGLMYSEFGAAWSIEPQDKQEEFIEPQTRRLVNICRVVNQAQLKKSTAPWYLNLEWVKAEAQAASSQVPGGSTGSQDRRRKRQATDPDAAQPSEDKANESQSSAKDGGTTAYFYGFSEELRSAWRKPASRPRAPQELTKDIRVRADALDSDPVYAVWADGAEHEITDITAKQWRDLCALHRHGSIKKVLWSGEHCVSHEKVEVKPRPDRHPLVSMYLMGKQVLQVREDTFASAECAQNFMVGLAERYCKNEFADVAALKRARDELHPLAQRTMKRPRGPEALVEGARECLQSEGQCDADDAGAEDQEGEEEEEEEGEERDEQFGEGEAPEQPIMKRPAAKQVQTQPYQKIPPPPAEGDMGHWMNRILGEDEDSE